MEPAEEINLPSPMGTPLGKDMSFLLKRYPHALYTHVPISLRGKVWKNEAAIEMKNLILDQRSFRSQPTMTLVQDPETNALQFHESNSIKDIYNWNQWQRAFRTFKALYLMAYPDKEPEMTKYENDIHVFSTQYYWNAVASYNLLFRQYLCDFPDYSWAKIDRDLFFSELVPNRMLLNVGNNPAKRKEQQGTGICRAYNRGNCIWGHHCQFEHKCNNCGRPGHSKLMCHELGTPFLSTVEDPDFDLCFSTDTSHGTSLGWGAFYSNQWMCDSWPHGFIDEFQPSIAWLEMYTLTLVVTTWSSQFAGKRARVWCDNTAVVAMINKQTTSDKCTMPLLRIVVYEQMLKNFELKATYIKSKDNSIADALSCLQMMMFQ